MSEDAKPAMVCSADDLLGWKDFPKGLKVLLLNEDSLSAAEIKSKLEKMDYDVTTFHNENEALEAISNKDESFHVAMVEMNIDNPHGSFKFLETARDLPIIMISSIHCLSTMMKCIALGAAEFLQRPVSEDKLRNIWQHVVHKAFNAGEGVLSKSLMPIKETVASMLQFQTETSDPETGNPFQTENEVQAHELEQYPAPSTPQLERGRLLGDGDQQDEPKCSIKKEIKEQDGKSTMLTKSSCSQSKSVENTWKHHSIDEAVIRESPSRPGDALNEDEVDSAEAMEVDECNTAKESGISSHSQNGDYVESTKEKENQNKASVFPKSSGARGSRRKMKVDWTQDLHRRFVKAVEQLGIDQAIPSKILELMKVEGLTRHNVASHLQKYRMHRRHIVSKEDERKWWPHKNLIQSGYTHRPLMAYPPYHSNYGIPSTQLYPVWGRPSSHPTNAQIWGHSGYNAWHPPESWPWKTYPEMQADAWGCPVVPPHVPCSTIPQNAMRFDRPYVIEGGKKFSENSFDLYPGEEVIDKVVKEVINQPWLPLPLGLKPPSTESVLTELHRQGIQNVPPYSC